MNEPRSADLDDTTSSSDDSAPLEPVVDQAKRDECSESIHFGYDNKNIDVSTMVSKLCPGKNETWLEQGIIQPPTSNQRPLGYLNKISAKLAADHRHPYTISFISCGKVAPKHHPTGTPCVPNLVAYKKVGKRTRIAKTIKWSQVEATVEVRSIDTPLEDSYAQGVTYSMYHLQARPDLVSVASLWIHDGDFKIFFTDASKVFHSHPHNDEERGRLMFAFLWHLYHPIVDPTIVAEVADTKSEPTTFTITKPEAYAQLSILRVGEAVGRRTTIFVQTDPASSLVIKEQYIDPRRRFNEGGLLSKIHDGRDFLGVVRLASFGEVEDDGSIVKASSRRVKTRLVLRDKGSPFEEIKTVREMLKVMYDLLEVLRLLYREKGILHRDISPGNILFREKTKPNLKHGDEGIGDMCFIDCLLKVQDGSEASIEDRLTTTVLLTDFDCGELRDKSSIQHRSSQTGTPAFMAVAARKNGPVQGTAFLPPIPSVREDILSRYNGFTPGAT